MISTVLVVEDDPDTLEIVRLYLRSDGHRVLTAGDGAEGARLAKNLRPDVVILDLMLPGMDGLEICRLLREASDVPIIMLTARVEEEDRLIGFDAGADDYVTKPFSPKELAARVRAVLRRSALEAGEQGPDKLAYDEMVVDLRQHIARLGGEQVPLTPTEFRILALLMREPGRVFGRDEIMDRAFGYGADGFDRTVDVHVANLRRKLQVDQQSKRYIHTVYGRGYRFGDG